MAKSEFHWVKTPAGAIEVYSNFTHTSWTLYDIRIQFGHLLPLVDDPNGTFVAEERAGVTLAWAQAKNLARVLDSLVKAYEAANGEIKPINLPNTPTVDPTTL